MVAPAPRSRATAPTLPVMPPSPEQLTCVSILICDDIYRDERTKKLVIVGTFNAVNALSLPCVQPRMRVLLSLTNGRGAYDLSVSVEHEKTGVEILEMKGPLRVDNPLQITDLDIGVVNLRLPEAGKYWVVVKAEGRILQQRPFFVHVAGQPTEGS